MIVDATELYEGYQKKNEHYLSRCYNRGQDRACSFHERAQKNHYLMEQIADFMKQLYEYFCLKKNEIKKAQKNISSELLASFGRQLTETEDISAQLNGSVVN